MKALALVFTVIALGACNKMRAAKGGTPSAPAGLVSAPNGFHAVDLAWRPSAIVVGAGSVGSYLIYRDGSVVAEVPGTQTAYTNAGLISGRDYTYRVTAVSSTGAPSTPSAPSTAKLAPDYLLDNAGHILVDDQGIPLTAD